jgi:hypothetical protein
MPQGPHNFSAGVTTLSSFLVSWLEGQWQGRPAGNTAKTLINEYALYRQYNRLRYRQYQGTYDNRPVRAGRNCS